MVKVSGGDPFKSRSYKVEDLLLTSEAAQVVLKIGDRVRVTKKGGQKGQIMTVTLTLT